MTSQYAHEMDSIGPGELVRVAGGGPPLDGIVFDTPSRTKSIVAVIDPARGPAFVTVHPKTLTARIDEGSQDRALWLLIRRTPTPARGGGGGAASSGRGRPGHARAAMHRTTGK